MQLSEIPEVQLEGGGVMFRYVRFTLELAGEKRRIVRGLNYLPYAPDMEKQIVEKTQEELRNCSFFDSGGNLTIEGGASLALNRYYETITLFGTSQSYGSDQDRGETAGMIEKVYPECEVSWYGVEGSTED